MKKITLLFLLIGLEFSGYTQGFSTSNINWSTPIGGYNSSGTNYGYTNIYGGSNAINNEIWSLADMNGDSKPDLVVTAICVNTSGGTTPRQFGAGSNPYWKVFLNTGSDMATTAINWSTPIGGYSSGGTNYGYTNIYGGSNALNNENWSLADMNGDSKPDLVVTSISVNTTGGTTPQQFGAGSNPYWKVYLNTGSGMSATAINWPTPIGGYYSSGTNYGYTTTNGGSNAINNEIWSLTDMNGDSKPDLVVTSIYINATGGTTPQQFGAGSNPYWKVYLNTGSGMATTATNWSTPIGGYNSGGTNYGYTSIYGGSNTINNEIWALLDMNGDSKPDLVVTSIYINATGGITPQQFGAGSNPYWKVYLNTGSGMATTATNWSTPIGGYSSGGTNYGYISIYGGSNTINNEIWSLSDINGDNKPDLVVTGIYINVSGSTTPQQFGAGSSPYWKVYLNTGSGMATTAINWSTPIGGFNSGGINYGYINTNGGSNLINNETWVLADMNGDSKPDLVVTSIYISTPGGTTPQQFGASSNPYWKVYLNTGITGIDNFQNTMADFSAYPNPFNGSFTLVTNPHLAGANFTLSDVSGKKIVERLITNPKEKIKADHIPKGLYFLKVNNQPNSVLKIVKQ